MTTNDQARPDDAQETAQDAGEANASASGAPRTGRLPYRAPQLRHLGSVRELTLGGTPQASEGAGTKGSPSTGKGGGGGKGM